jgi:hypothetical protein
MRKNTVCAVGNETDNCVSIGIVGFFSGLDTPSSKREDAILPRQKGLSSILRLMQETEEERAKAREELEDPTTRDLGELRLRLAYDRHKFLDLLKRRQHLAES